MVVLQKAPKGAHASKLLHNRFQVLESGALKNRFYLVDHTLGDDMVVRSNSKDPKSEIVYHASLEEALAEVKRRAGLPAGKTPPRVVEAITPKKKAVSASSDKKPRALSPARMFHQLLTETPNLTDEEIYHRVHAQFPTMSYRPTYPGWYRKKLAEGTAK